ncbi:MAG: MoCo/4Fe-4S cofactor protein with predicted Tat translocation signal [Saprospiraceae bacterium]|jgi:MoCo/4Fe-4S cofactor protein with predicted Tat translocation signal
MKDNTSNIWIGGKDLTNDPEFIEISQKEFAEPTNLIEDLGNEEVAASMGGNRRDFLKFLGFGLGAATVAAGCDIPVKRAIPYVVKPDSIVPGVASYYSSTYVSGGESLPILVKTREGRPIKIEGNISSSITHGGTSARAQASVLSLYDTSRFATPKMKSSGEWTASNWADVDKAVSAALVSAKGVRVVTNTVLSPTAKAAMSEFTDKFGASVVTYDPVSSAAILDANEQSFGDRVIPDYRFDKADVIVSFGADFLGTWISPVEYSSQWVKGRKIADIKNPTMSRHIQVESGMSMTGSNADNRIMVRPSEMGAAIAYLANKIVGGISAPALNAEAEAALDKIAVELGNARGKSLIVSGSNNVSEQILVNAINNALGNLGTTVNFTHASLQRQGSEKELTQLVSDINSGSVDVVIFNQCNPAYDFAGTEALKTALAKVKTKISFATSNDETTDMCDIIAPTNHSLESWGDVEAKRGQFSIIQPTISNLFDTRQYEQSLLTWAGSSSLDGEADQPYFDYLKASWEKTVFASQSKFSTFQSFWDSVLQDGVYEGSGASSAPSFSGNVSSAASGISKPSSSDVEVSFYESIAQGNGQFANNPWLQEMPDPVTRTSWGNYLAVPVNFDGVRTFVGYNDLVDGDLVDVTIGAKTVRVPVVQQFGQMAGTVSLALGYGREFGIKGDAVGVNVNDVLTIGKDGNTNYYNTSASITNKVGKEDYFSCVQYHHTMGVKAEEKGTGEIINADEAATVFFDYFTGVKGFQGSLTDRSIIYNSTIKDLKENVEVLEGKRAHAQHLNAQQIYGGFDDKYEMGHHWGMNVDLNSCTGCGACTVACMSENNVPVVGKREVSRHHEMSWLRIDRYYYGDAKNPNVVYQPMMCQHCDNAPCENVCPVNATNHSSEGLNQMTYNRCIGTRYCANNCPYKVRRFNWLDYTTADLFPANQPSLAGEEVPFGADNLTRMVLNPDVTVRSRGVIEKCSFCVQRLQSGKLTAKIEGRRLNDNDVSSACMTACPTGAITFGDLNNKKSELVKKNTSPLSYLVLEEVNIRPSVTYTMKVNNRDTSFDA